MEYLSVPNSGRLLAPFPIYYKIMGEYKIPVKSASKKLAPNNLAPLKLACRNMDWDKENRYSTSLTNLRN